MTTMLKLIRLTSRATIIGIVLLVAVAIHGCSMTRVAYRNAPDLMLWWADGYVDLQGDQSPRAREAIAEWLRWHRSTQLPDYAGLLAQLRAEVADPATPEQTCRWWGEWRSRFVVAVDRGLPSLAEFALTFSPQQVRNVERKLAKNRDKMRRDLAVRDPEARREAMLKRTLDRAQMLYGRFDEAQRRAVAEGLAASPFDIDRTLAERAARHRDIVETLGRIAADQPAHEAAVAALRRLAERNLDSPDASHRAYQQRVTEYNCRMAAQIHNLTTPAQRRHAADKLSAWEADALALSAREH